MKLQVKVRVSFSMVTVSWLRAWGKAGAEFVELPRKELSICRPVCKVSKRNYLELYSFSVQRTT